LSANHATVAQRDDALLREIRLASLLGHFDRAIDLIEHHHFHSWEGEGGVHDVYADAHLGRARRLSRQGRHQEALRDCEAALKHPENLESARAHRSGREVQTYCLMGKAHAAMGDPTRALQCFQQSVAAYSDKADHQFRYWYALACRELGDEARAQKALDSLTQTGREMLAKGPPVDFFSKFGSRQSPIAHQASAHYLLGLAHLGQRRPSDAKREFDEALRTDPSHFGAHMMAAELRD
jgi:tetratricopeptide (TPR) repeat protein